MAEKRELRRLETASMVFQEMAEAEGEYAVIDVRTKKPDASVGTIRWYGPRHQYAFLPAAGGLYIGRELCDIYDVLGRMMSVIRERKRKPRRAPG